MPYNQEYDYDFSLLLINLIDIAGYLVFSILICLFKYPEKAYELEKNGKLRVSYSTKAG